MVLVVVAPAIAVALGVVVATGGSINRISSLRWRWPVTLAVALGLQLGLEFGPRLSRHDLLGWLLLVTSYALLLAFCAANVTRRGIEIVALGIAMNGLAIVLNHGMPARAPAGRHVVTTVKHHALDNHDRFPILGDVIVVRPLGQAISFGDLVIAVGLVDAMVGASRASAATTRASY